MVADSFFELRPRLGAALFPLGRLAEAAGLRPGRGPVIRELTEQLRDPFVFVVAGEVNSGKSSLLNALFGEEFCATGVLPETQRIHFFRYAKKPERVAAGGTLEEIGLPHAFLRDFHVVDTPGINSVAAGHEILTGDFMPRADAVIYCFPATNPWSEAGWNFLERIRRDWLKKTVLVLQQSDLRTPEEMHAIAEHMRAVARQRLGEALAVFPVSARLGFLARTSGLDKERLLAASGLPAFEKELTAMISRVETRIGKLVPVCAAAQAVLAEVQAKLEADGAQVEELQRIQVMAGEMLAGAHAPVAAAAASLAQEMRAAWDRLTAGAPALPTAGGEAAGAVERALLPPLMEAVRDLAGRFDGALDGVLAALWKQPGSALHRALQGRVRRPPEPDWPARLKHLTATLENAACAAVAQSGVAEHCQGIIRRRRLVRGMTAGGLALGTAMVAAGLSGILPWAGAVLTGLGLSGVVVWQVGRRTAPPATGPALAEAGRRLEEETLALAQEHGTRRLADFSPLLDPLPEVIQFRKGNLIPLLAESAQLALTLQNLARALQPDRSAAPPPDRL